MAGPEINGGYTLLPRKLFASGIMRKPPLYLKLWVWMISQASHKNHGSLKRGQLFASIDVGTNSMKLFVGELPEDANAMT